MSRVPEPSARRYQLAIVDDDPDMVNLLERIIAKEFAPQIEVHTFTDPLQAKSWLDAKCCDVLVTDIQMPGMDGLQLAEFAKARNAWTQIIFITAHSTLERVQTAWETGGSHYLQKPLKKQEILDAVAQDIAQRVHWQLAMLETFRRAYQQYAATETVGEKLKEQFVESTAENCGG